MMPMVFPQIWSTKLVYLLGGQNVLYDFTSLKIRFILWPCLSTENLDKFLFIDSFTFWHCRKSKWVGSPPFSLFCLASMASAQSLAASVPTASLCSCWNTWLKGGDPTHFDFRERVVTDMMGKLTKTELDKLQRMAEEYNMKGVDLDLKSK